jgi:mRNA interferase MazF
MVKRGEIWIVDLDPGFGREIRKKRPVLIITADAFNSLHTAVVIPFNSRVPIKIGLEMIQIAPDKQNNLDRESILLPIFVRAVDNKRFIKKLGTLADVKFFEVEEALKLVLGLTPLDI